MNHSNSSTHEQYVAELKNNRINNSAKTVLITICSKTICIIMPFLIRTLMIYYLGDSYCGLNSLIISIISLLNVAELGLSSVITFFLFDPLAVGDTERVNNYLNVLKTVYNRIGISILVLGIIITPFLPFFSKNDIPSDVNIYLIFLIYLIAASLQYFIIPETIVLSNALQKGYITGILNIVGSLVVYTLQIIAILCFHSFTLYFVAILIQCILLAILRYCVKHSIYQSYYPNGTITSEDKSELKKKVVSLIGHQMDEKMISSIDNVIISTLLGLVAVTHYGNYMYVLSAIHMFLVAIFDSLTASIGNALVTEEVESNYVRFKAVLWLNGIIVSWAAVCMVCIYQPFMKLWMGEKRLLPFSTVLLFCLYFFISEIRTTVITFKNAKGMWYEDRFKPYVSMAVNLIMDVYLVYLIGINGALISSIFCFLFIEIPWEGTVLYKGYFQKRTSEYLLQIIKHLFFSTIAGIPLYFVCQIIFFKTTHNIISLILCGLFVTTMYIFISLIFFHNSTEIKIWIQSINLFFNNMSKGNHKQNKS